MVVLLQVPLVPETSLYVFTRDLGFSFTAEKHRGSPKKAKNVENYGFLFAVCKELLGAVDGRESHVHKHQAVWWKAAPSR